MAEVGDRFGRALGGDDEVSADRRPLPDMGHGEQVGAKAVGVHQRPMRVQVRSLGNCSRARSWNAFSIGSNGSGALARMPNSLSHGRCRHFRSSRRGRRIFPSFAPQFGDRHPVLGQCAGLVGAQHRRGAQGFDRRSAPGQHARPRDSPGAHRHEDSEHDRELFGQHRHAERDAGQHGIEPSATQDSVEQHRQDAHRAADNGEHRTSRRVCACSRGGSVSSSASDWPILPISLRGPVAVTSPFPAAHDQRTRKHVRQIVATRPLGCGRHAIVPRDLAHGNGLAGQQRFIGLQIVALQRAPRRPARGRPRQARRGRRARPRGRRSACARRRE